MQNLTNILPISLTMLQKGYKGFDKNLQCKDYKYQRFELNEFKGEPKVGSRGLHFHTSLSGCVSNYSNNGENIFAEVQAHVKIDTIDGKSFATNCLTITRMLDKDEILKILANELVLEKISRCDTTFNLPIVRKLQQTYPNLIIGGSIGLFLQGIVLDRDETDLDIILPYWDNIFTEKFFKENDAKLNECILDGISDKQTHKSGSDFDDNGTIIFWNKYIKFDMLVNPKQKFKMVTYNNFEYKVVDWKETLEYKLKYAKEGNQKHNNDLNQILELIKK